jgi:hypothetical protein
MALEDVSSTEVLRYGAYLCLDVPPGLRRLAASAAVPQVADRLGLRNEFEPEDGHPPDAVAYLRRVTAAPADIADDQLLGAYAIVHVASAAAGLVEEFCAEFTRLLGPQIMPRILDGVVRPTRYTGNAMHNFAYARAVGQQPGAVMPNALLVPMRKTAEWWNKDWMERHTYFLPRYDASGRMLNQGHVLTAAPGIPCLMRRTYWNASEPAPPGAYDFITYFECADNDVPLFHEVCTALRDIAKNPEWTFVREGPTWHGSRAASWAELFR